MAPADRRPIAAGELPALFAGLEGAAALALAVSGGSDSMALLYLAHGWRAALDRGPALIVLSVDHRLRPESAAESAAVMAVAARYGVPARTLVWQGPHPATGVEEAARDARYRLLAMAADELGVSHVLTAHHQDDQAETFLMRLGRGSGVAGLAAMRRERPLGRVRLVRPLLEVAKSRLVATAVAAGLPFSDDLMNTNPRFARARLRSIMPTLAGEGLDAPTLARAAARMARADAALEATTTALLAACATVDATAAVTVDVTEFRRAPEEIRLRTLARLVAAVGGRNAPRAERLEGLARALSDPAPVRRTLAGALVSRRGDRLTITREWGRNGLPAIGPSAGFDGVWDGRFRVRFAGAAVTLGALGPDAREFTAAARAAGLAATPALRRDARLLAAPLAGLAAPAGVDFEVGSLVAARLGIGPQPAPFTFA